MKIAKSVGWGSTKLKGRTVIVKVGQTDDQDIVMLGFGKRLTPESIGGNKRVQPVAFARLSPNKRMHFTEIALSPESALELHRLLDKTLRDAGLLHDTLEESLAKRFAAFFSRMIMVHVYAIYSKQIRYVSRLEQAKAPA